jgi:hypothetical protein
MATLQTQSTKGAPVTVIYPAERPTGHSAVVLFRVGKKTVLPAYADANLPYLVQFQRGQRIFMVILSDVLEPSYWRRIRNAYNLFGQLDLDPDARMGTEETKRVVRWLREQSAARGIALDRDHVPAPDQTLASEEC